MYFTATIPLSKRPKIVEISIDKQGEIVEQFGYELNIPRAMDLVREASNDFKYEHPKALELDGAIKKFLDAKGFSIDDNQAKPTSSNAKSKKLKIAKAKLKIQAQRIRILKLQKA